MPIRSTTTRPRRRPPWARRGPDVVIVDGPDAVADAGCCLLESGCCLLELAGCGSVLFLLLAIGAGSLFVHH